MTKEVSTMWAVIYRVNWGSRQLQYDKVYVCNQEPSIEQAVRLLRAYGVDASEDWFNPENSGLVRIDKINVHDVNASDFGVFRHHELTTFDHEDSAAILDRRKP